MIDEDQKVIDRYLIDHMPATFRAVRAIEHMKEELAIPRTQWRDDESPAVAIGAEDRYPIS